MVGNFFIAAISSILLCLLKSTNAAAPLFWNQLEMINTVYGVNGIFYIYYGWDSALNTIFFKLAGTNANWMGMGRILKMLQKLQKILKIPLKKAFGTNLDNVDMVYLQNKNPLATSITDAWSTSSVAVPTIDTIQHWSCDPSPCPVLSLTGTDWSNIIFKRVSDTGDLLQDTKIDDTPRTITFLFGTGAALTSYSSKLYSVTFAQYQVCDSVCALGACTGPESNQCTSCSNPDKVLVTQSDGTTICVWRFPVIWNQIDFLAANQSVYYGFDTNITVPTPPPSPAFIYFKFTGNHIGYQGISFTSSLNAHINKDMIVVRKECKKNFRNKFFKLLFKAGILKIEDRFSAATPTSDPITGIYSGIPVLDAKNNVFYCSGDRDIDNNWNVVVVRQLSTLDPDGTKPDYIIQAEGDPIAKPPLANPIANLAVLPTAPGVRVGYTYHQTDETFTKRHCQASQSSPTTCATNYYDYADVIFHYQQICNVNCQPWDLLTGPLPTVCSTSLRKGAPYCTGPEPNQCTQCQTGYMLQDDLCPGICIPIPIICHEDCLTCTGNFNTDCTSCKSDSNVLYFGRCIPKTPIFWNLITFGPADVYYGKMTVNYKPSIPFVKKVMTRGLEARIKGQHQLILSVTFFLIDFLINSSISPTTQDMIILNDELPQVRDAYSWGSDSMVYADTVNHVVYCSGGYVQNLSGKGKYDVVVVRKADTLELSQDTAITDLPLNIAFAYHNTNMLFKSQNLPFCDCSVTCPCTSKHDSVIPFTNKILYKYQICDPSCSTCVGPSQKDCTQCPTNKALQGASPTSCVDILSTNCHPDCVKCYGQNSASQCLSCSNPTKTIYNGICIPQTPAFKNQIYFPLTNFFLYYGFDSAANPTYVYFRLIGSNAGWIGLGFGTDHIGVDMMSARINQNKVLVEDRWSESNSEPQVDNSYVGGVMDDVYIQGGRTNGQWDVTIVRAINTGDAKDKIIDENPLIVSLALGFNDNFEKHIAFQKLSTSFIRHQLCDETCDQCVSPQNKSCVSCIDGTDLDSSAPTSCLIQYAQCHITCKTCTGPSALECLECANDKQLVIQGECLGQYPLFWNKLPIAQTYLNLYYGYDSSLKYIYFQLLGSTTQQGWIGLGFGINMSNTDMIVLRKPSISTEFLVQDRFSYSHDRPPILDTDDFGSRDVYYSQGGRDGENWNVTFVRARYTGDQNDVEIDSLRKNISLAFGDSDEFNQHSTKIQFSSHFVTSQVCDPTCVLCTGPEKNMCTACYIGFILQSESPSECVASKLNCHIDCATCTGDTAADCTTCANSNKIAYKGSCINQTPVLWNQIAIKPKFDLFYGFDTSGKHIYFKMVGESSGWIALGFGDSMTKVDMIVVYQETTKVVITDRYSYGHTQPAIDAREDVTYIGGDRDAVNNWDVSFVRALNTKDSGKDEILSTDNAISMIFAFGETDYFAKHVTNIVIPNIKFSINQVCAPTCTECTGPELADCKSFAEAKPSNSTSESQNQSSSSIRDVFIILMLALIPLL